MYLAFSCIMAAKSDACTFAFGFLHGPLDNDRSPLAARSTPARSSINVQSKGMVQIFMVKFNSNMATKLDDYICMQMCWPVAMNPVEKLTAAMLKTTRCSRTTVRPMIAFDDFASSVPWV